MSGDIQTRVFKVDPQRPEPQIIERVAAIIRKGGLVAFPTETVYGLGANAFDESAVRGIFAAKGRPSTNPIIVHVGSIEGAQESCSAWPDKASQLAAAFWPGPLTMVLPKSTRIPAIITAGRETVAVRMPAHPVALALLKACSFPVAAPSANRSSEISPTRAEHVLKGLSGRIDAIVDGGATIIGIESTVVDLTRGTITILRAGSVSRGQIESILNECVEYNSRPLNDTEAAPSPGMLAKHYAPRARVEILETPLLISQLRNTGSAKVVLGVLARTADAVSAAKELRGSVVRKLADESTGYAQQLYSALHELDEQGVSVILVECPPMNEEWRAVHDRLKRMAHVDPSD